MRVSHNPKTVHAISMPIYKKMCKQSTCDKQKTLIFNDKKIFIFPCKVIVQITCHDPRQIAIRIQYKVPLIFYQQKKERSFWCHRINLLICAQEYIRDILKVISTLRGDRNDFEMNSIPLWGISDRSVNNLNRTTELV